MCALWLCQVCGSRFRCKAKGSRQACAGASASNVVQACKLAHSQGHNITMAMANGARAFNFVFCHLCFHYSGSRVSGLGRECKGCFSKQAKRAKFIRGGFHPTVAGCLLSGFTRFCPGCFGAGEVHFCARPEPLPQPSRPSTPPIPRGPSGFDGEEADAWEPEEEEEEDGFLAF